ncbi:MAG TPA: protoglobin domain-containing protein [Labilithrix sp.]|nr:protoglobin domain-containing protein [Labilithrix sp.]
METRFDELKRYVRFTEEDTRLLVALREVAAPHFSRIAQQFYDRIREHEDAHAILLGEDQIGRLQQSLVSWLERLLGGCYDEHYFEQTARIGRVHVRVGLPQRYVFTAMAVIRSSLTAIAATAMPESQLEVCDGLSRLLDVELAIMVEAFREDLVARIERAASDERDVLRRRVARAEQRYVNAVELADLIIVGLGAAGEILLFNRQAERVTGYARDEVMGRSLVELVVPGDLRQAHEQVFRPAPAASLHTVPVGGSPEESLERSFELPLQTRAGKMRDVRWRVVGVPHASDDREIELFAMGYDITDERAARDRAQQQERLAAVGTLAAGLAHEIRNPLNGALLHVSFLERALTKTEDNEDALMAVKVVRDEIQRLARLSTDFLDFARPRPLIRTGTSVRALCERAVQLVSERASEAVALELDLPTTDVVLSVDDARLEQALVQLLHNAIDAVSPRGGKVVLRARRRPRHARIEVVDDGPGLPPGNLPIFDAFFSTKPKGTGMGLAIVHRVVADHGGSIEVDSRANMTCFRVELPLTDRGAV